jgi:hypothetical protein
MTRTQLKALVCAMLLIVALLDLWTSAALIGAILFIVPLTVSALLTSKRILWSTAAAASLFAVAAG